MTGDFYQRAIARIYRNIYWAAGIGTVAAAVWKGWTAAAGFALGAALAWLNFYWLHKLVDSLGGTEPAPTHKSLAVAAGLRYLLFGGVAYAMMKVLEISVEAIVAGVLVMVAAVLMEVLYQLFYART